MDMKRRIVGVARKQKNSKFKEYGNMEKNYKNYRKIKPREHVSKYN